MTRIVSAFLLYSGALLCLGTTGPIEIPLAQAQSGTPTPELSPLQRLRHRQTSPTPAPPAPTPAPPTPTIYKTPSGILTPRLVYPSPRSTGSGWGTLLETLPLMPDRDRALRMDGVFQQKVRLVNLRIQERQRRLHVLLEDWTSDPDQIRGIQAELSELRTERDRLALEHLLLMRQLERHFVIPPPAQSSPSPSPQADQE